MSAAGRWFFTPHAVERFRSRVAPSGTSYEQALSILVQDSAGAHFIRMVGDAEQWRGPKPMRLRYRVMPAEGDGLLPCVVTVMPEHDRWKH